MNGKVSDKNYLREEKKIEDKFYNLVDKKDNEIEKCSIEGNWAINKKEGIIRVCSYYNEKRDMPTTHRRITVEYDGQDKEFVFKNWLGDSTDLDHEIEVGLTSVVDD